MSVKALVVGNGPTHHNIDFIKSFDGTIISCDIVARDMVNSGIIPDYITFSETKEGLVEKAHVYLPKSFSKIPTTVVFRLHSIDLIRKRAATLELNWLAFNVESYVNNVGLFSVMFAIKHLKVEELHLIGLEHKWYEGDDANREKYQNWIKTFKKYLSTKPNCKIIDHSNGELSSLVNT